ncbi:hypothetical protein MRX96_026997 [Rhipicephalus microplus]
MRRCGESSLTPLKESA